ncbi:MAG: hypothetical protein Q9220_005735 [cf. Caloplaca sp. 1 TL-2023]
MGNIAQDKLFPQRPKRQSVWLSRKRIFIVLIAAVVFIVALAVGLGVGLTRHHSSDDTSDPNDNDNSSSNLTAPITTTNSSNVWQPTAGTTWQIVLLDPLVNTTYPNVSVFDIDLFNNTADTISTLHSQGKKVICYFSVGSYEDFRPDSGQFLKGSDYGKPLQGWQGEWWANTRSENVRKIMLKRLDLAVEKSCDGVDPDNIDAYDNDNGLGLTIDDAIDYVNFLADAAHSRNMSVGLKNAGTILREVESRLQWSVNEQCVQYDECDTYQPFVDHGKPVFHIEYPSDAPSITGDDKSKHCDDNSEKRFSTVLKKMELDEWLYACPST